MENKKINIAIDGYSSCGKGTLARYLANELEYRFIDSGSMYRAITYFLIQESIPVGNTEYVKTALSRIKIDFEWTEDHRRFEICLNGKNIEREIRTPEVAASVSEVARIAEVREFLVRLQREMAVEKGVVMDGRDIGTVVLPDAELKIFMTAKAEIRAERRLKELLEAGVDASYSDVLANLLKRDNIDSTREHSPLTLTADYRIMDNSGLSVEEQNEIAMGWLKEVLDNH